MIMKCPRVPCFPYFKKPNVIQFNLIKSLLISHNGCNFSQTPSRDKMTVFHFAFEGIPTYPEIFFFCVMAENIITNPDDIV